MINIISAIGSMGTFIMAIFYFVSVSVQLYQMKISFIPALGFNQILLEKDKNKKLNLKNMIMNSNEHEDHLKLYNLGGGAAKKITIEILLGENKVIQTKYVSMLPSKEGYMLPLNKKVFDELDKTIQNNGYESDLNIKLTYYHNVSRKQHEVLLRGNIDSFNTYENKSIYELQFIQVN
ncbi:hypothetical protein ISO99_06745 [Staphylococcus sp. 18_1_E_LY]|uniref:Uncharacterized protein n=1 Tax=Staphylococcus lloydii TaxID=2781774 RepID=A0A7T1F981_9STAP|nr:hypothetical protein [Staphylococcus lloydii]MBF7019608.1 hypothetical protein [Staphylococcus lloydii]MBF7027336.1 hypothetical protein [Staphylococcus lloydii]MDU9419030.1 hypothetical protein [Staphylococcus lloydii]QPM75000.1 hypothetical protein ISP08_11880 [Staphylococcus lloydii]